jgi:hypothetical protein
MAVLRGIALWFEDRLQIARLFDATAGHRVPSSTNSWFYVFGSGTPPVLCDSGRHGDLPGVRLHSVD